jgi:hypothetical protein
MPSESSHDEPFLYRLDMNPGPCRVANSHWNDSSTRNRTVLQPKREACCSRYACCGFVRQIWSDYLHCARFGVRQPKKTVPLDRLALPEREQEIESTGDNCSERENDAKRWKMNRWSSQWSYPEVLKELVPSEYHCRG